MNICHTSVFVFIFDQMKRIAQVVLVLITALAYNRIQTSPVHVHVTISVPGVKVSDNIII